MKCCGIVRLEIRRLIREQRVRRRMRLVEAVAGEELDELEDLARPSSPEMPRSRQPLMKASRCACIFAASFLPIARRSSSAWPSVKPASSLASRMTCSWYAMTPYVSLSTGSICGELVLDLDAAVLAVDVVVDDAAAQRTGPVQRVQRDQVLETLRLGLAQRVAHARALELEHAVRLAVLEQLIGLRIVERQLLEVDLVARRLLDVLDRVVEQRERAQAQEVHLQEADALDLLHRPLRRDFAFVLLALVERRELRDAAGAR